MDFSLSPMDQKIATAEKEILVEIVKLSQKEGMKGAKGSWKQFLDCYDRKFGSSLSDPARRSVDVLTAFLKTFTKEEDLKFFTSVMRSHSNRKTVEQLTKTSVGVESAKQRLVQLTHEHPQYLLDYSFPSYNEDWVVSKITKRSKSMLSNSMISIDCEMVLCEDGTEAVVRVCAVDHNLEVKLNELVNPNKAVADYRTAITGVSAKDLEGITCYLADIQKSMKKLLSHGTILVGHSLNNDLQALKLDHGRVIDTCFIFKYHDDPTFRRPSLNNLCKTVLGYEIRRKDAPHNCLDDANAAMKLVLAKLEHGFDDPIALAQEVPETEMAKLLLHGIPIDVPTEELRKIFPEGFTIELEPNKNARRQKYSVIAIFKDAQEAHKAFESTKGKDEKDSSGRPQKLISFTLSTGLTASLHVRKMARNDPFEKPALKKRSMQDEEILDESKNPKTTKKPKTNKEKIEEQETKTDSNQCDQYIKEIERLKQELKQRDHEILHLHKIISALTRKQGL